MSTRTARSRPHQAQHHRPRSSTKSPGIQTFAYDSTARLTSLELLGEKGPPEPPPVPKAGTSPQNPEEDVRMYEALLCTLLARAGGSVRLPLGEIVDCGNGLQFHVRPTADGRALELAVGPNGGRTRRRRNAAHRRAP